MKYIQEYGSTALIIVLGLFVIYRLFVPAPHALIGKPAPDFTLATPEGKEVSLAAHRGKEVVVLDFWATWCPGCRQGLPVVDSVAKKFADKPVAVYAVNIREGAALVQQYLSSTGLTVTPLMDDSGLVADDYLVTGIPQTVIIDKNGRIENIHVGLPPYGFEKALSEDINSALQPPQQSESAE